MKHRKPSLKKGRVKLKKIRVSGLKSTKSLVIFILLFAAIGCYLLIRSFAATPYKPVIKGLIDRGVFPSTTRLPNATYNNVVPNIVVNATWANLQPTANGPIASNNVIDQYITNMRNNKPGGLIKIRLAAGFFAPNWVKQLDDGPGGTTITNATPISYADSYNGNLDTIPRFWTKSVQAAYQDLQNKLAAKYDNVPEVGAISISLCSTAFPEEYLRGASGGGKDVVGVTPTITARQYDAQSLTAAGFTPALDSLCHDFEIEAHDVWAKTRSTLALNPYDKLNTSTQNFTIDTAYTETKMTYCRQVLSKRCVLENDSMRPSFLPNFPLSRTIPPTGDMQKMYWRMWMLGPPISIQTATSPNIEDWRSAIDGAIKLGANAVELVNDYPAQGYPVPELSVYNQRLLDNWDGEDHLTNSIQAEQGSRSGGATAVIDSNASGGQYVRFGTTSGGGASCTRTISTGTSITSTINTMSSGQVLCLNSGIYAEDVTLGRSITLQEAPGASATIRKITISASNSAVIGLEITAGSDPLVRVNSGVSDVLIKANKIHDGTGNGMRTMGNRVTIQDNEMYSFANEDAIRLWGDGLIIRNNYIHDVQNSGHNDPFQTWCLVSDGCPGPELTNLTMEDNIVVNFPGSNGHCIMSESNLGRMQNWKIIRNRWENIGAHCIMFGGGEPNDLGVLNVELYYNKFINIGGNTIECNFQTTGKLYSNTYTNANSRVIGTGSCPILSSPPAGVSPTRPAYDVTWPVAF